MMIIIEVSFILHLQIRLLNLYFILYTLFKIETRLNRLNIDSY
jgi:hypothetical protein